MFNLPKYRFSKKDKRRAELRILQVVLGVLIGLVLAIWLVFWQTGKDRARILDMRQEAQQVQPHQDIPPHTTKIGGPFELINQDKKKVTDANYRGKYLLVYFGYIYCPDLCPTGLQSIAHAMDRLGPEGNKVQPLYITIDPDRDTPAKLKEYIASFHPKIVGLTGSRQQIAAVAKAYQVYYKKGDQVDGQDYIMEHSSLIYLMGPEGQFISTFQEDVDPEALVKALHGAWAEKPALPK